MHAATGARTALFAHPVQPRATDERWTPPWVFEALGLAYDLDPATAPGGVPWVPAARHYCADDDGLAQRWEGLVWLNPPFSNPAPWVERWIDHGNGVLLFPWNANASWVHRLLEHVAAVALLEHVRFVHPTHTGRHVPVACAVTGLGAGAGAAQLLAATGRATLLLVP